MTARGLRGPNASIEAVVVRDRSEVSRRMQDANDANQIVQGIPGYSRVFGGRYI